MGRASWCLSIIWAGPNRFQAVMLRNKGIYLEIGYWHLAELSQAIDQSTFTNIPGGESGGRGAGLY